jgi:hypothetical protein
MTGAAVIRFPEVAPRREHAAKPTAAPVPFGPEVGRDERSRFEGARKATEQIKPAAGGSSCRPALDPQNEGCR